MSSDRWFPSREMKGGVVAFLCVVAGILATSLLCCAGSCHQDIEHVLDEIGGFWNTTERITELYQAGTDAYDRYISEVEAHGSDESLDVGLVRSSLQSATKWYEEGEAWEQVAVDRAAGIFFLLEELQKDGCLLWSEYSEAANLLSTSVETHQRAPHAQISNLRKQAYNKYIAAAETRSNSWKYYYSDYDRFEDIWYRANALRDEGISLHNQFSELNEQQEAGFDNGIVPALEEIEELLREEPSLPALIEEQMVSKIEVYVDGTEYWIVELARKIDPDSLEPVYDGLPKQLYTNTSFHPVGDRSTVQKLDIVKTAYEYTSRLRQDNLDGFIDDLEERLQTHRWIKISNFFARQQATLLATAIKGLITGGQSVPGDVLDQAVSVAIEVAKDPLKIYESEIYADFEQAEKAYAIALDLAEEGAITNYQTGRDFLEQLYLGYSTHMPAQFLLDELDNIQQSIPGKLKEIGEQVAIALVDETHGVLGQFQDLIQQATQEVPAFHEYWDDRKKFLDDLQRILTKLHAEGIYTLKLAAAEGES